MKSITEEKTHEHPTVAWTVARVSAPGDRNARPAIIFEVPICPLTKAGFSPTTTEAFVRELGCVREVVRVDAQTIAVWSQFDDLDDDVRDAIIRIVMKARSLEPNGCTLVRKPNTTRFAKAMNARLCERLREIGAKPSSAMAI